MAKEQLDASAPLAQADATHGEQYYYYDGEAAEVYADAAIVGGDGGYVTEEVAWNVHGDLSDQYAGYEYDPVIGEYVYTGGAESAVEGSYFALDDPAVPTSPFGDEAYWQQYGEDAVNPVEAAVESGLAEEFPIGDTGILNIESSTQVQEETPASTSGEGESTLASLPTSAPANSTSTPSTSTPPTSSQSKPRKKKVKTKQERVQMRQAQLEKEEAEQQEMLQSPDAESTAATTAATHSPQSKTVARQPSRRAETRPPTFLERERAKVRLRMRKLRSIRRKRMPLQVRILTATRTQLSPMEIYFGGSVEAALSDIFWAAMKGDLRRVRFLVEIENVSVTDYALDPWNMEQTPLHWAAKGGSADVIEYLLQAGANPRSMDENGSLPLHLACWAGHVDATLALLRATDRRDLYVQDYDAALAPLDWAQIRGHSALVKAIERFEDATWLPKFVDDLIRGIIRYKIKLYKESPTKSPGRGLRFRRAAGGAPESEVRPPDNQKADDSAAKAVDAQRAEGQVGADKATAVPELTTSN